MPSSDPNCIFCKIVAGRIPCHQVYEDDRLLAFLDVGPLSKGHTLLIPKAHAAALDELDEESAAALGRVLPRACRALKQVSGSGAYNVLINTGRSAGQLVEHVHVHIIPRFEDSGLGLRWPAGKLDAEAGKKLAEAIGKAML